MTTTTPRFPHVYVPLVGEDGNVFAIIGRVNRSLRKAGVSQQEVDNFSKEVMNTESYDEALAVVMRWVDVS